jgi:hypothetical protein
MTRYVVLSPDDLPIRPTPFRSRAAAEQAITEWCQRFAAQGYYASVTGPITLDQLPARCRIETCA